MAIFLLMLYGAQSPGLRLGYICPSPGLTKGNAGACALMIPFFPSFRSLYGSLVYG